MNKSVAHDLTIIVVSFNSGSMILSTLGNLLELNPCRIIIVDNASTDGSFSLLKNSFPHIEILRSKINIGYGRAANLGLHETLTDYCLLINPDIKLNQSQLENVFQDFIINSPETAIYSPATKTSDFIHKGCIDVDYLIGAFLLIKMSALKEVGFFDEKIFLFYEEKDLELRLIRNGYKLTLQTDIYIEHIGRASTEANEKIDFLRNWHVAWSSLHYFFKHGFMTRRYQAILLTYKYLFKSISSMNSDKRLKYRARFLGCKAYLEGEDAFNSNGDANLSETLIN